MEKISAEEVKNIEVGYCSGGRWGQNKVLNEAQKLEIGEGLKVEKDEWEKKTSPAVLLNSSMARYGKKVSVKSLTDKSGWLVVRLK